MVEAAGRAPPLPAACVGAPRGRAGLPACRGRDDAGSSCVLFTSAWPCGRCLGYIRECRTDAATGLYTIACHGCGQVRIKPAGGAR